MEYGTECSVQLGTTIVTNRCQSLGQYVWVTTQCQHIRTYVLVILQTTPNKILHKIIFAVKMVSDIVWRLTLASAVMTGLLGNSTPVAFNMVFCSSMLA